MLPHMDNFEKLEVVNGLASFIGTATNVLLPLYLMSLGYGLEGMGEILLIFFIVFPLLRIIFAYLAEHMGIKSILKLHSIFLFLEQVFYIIANGPLCFYAARAVRGVWNSALYAVNRTAAYIFGGHSAKQTIKLIRTNTLMKAAGSVLAGVILAIVGFKGSFTLLAITAIFIAILTNSLPNIKETKAKRKVKIKDFKAKIKKKREKYFWLGSLSVGIRSAAYIVISMLFIPYIFKEVFGLTSNVVALIMAGFQITATASVWITAGKLKNKPLIIALLAISSLTLPFFFVISWLNLMMSIILLMLYGIIFGFIWAVEEGIIATTTRKSKTPSFDISLFWMPTNLIAALLLITLPKVTSIIGMEKTLAITGSLMGIGVLGYIQYLRHHKRIS